ncbi:MAG: DUF2933 domain-containing protein [Ktedonobacteraceae bacterium]
MQYILSLLPLLACPVGMGLIMWFMMRGHKEQPMPQDDRSPVNTSGEAYATGEAYPPVEDTKPVDSGSEPSRKPSIFSMLFLCLNWKVVGGLAVVAVIIGIIAPKLLLGAIPLLIVVACPLSMLFTMRGMQHGESLHVQQPASYSAQENPSYLEGPTGEDRVASLKAQLAYTEAQQQDLARQIAELEIPQAATRSETDSVSSRK